MNQNSLKIKRLVGIASLLTIACVLQGISGFIQFGPFNITLALLLPLIVGAILYGPTGGAILGLGIGFIVLASGQATHFLAINPLATVFLCLVKTAVAGLISGLIFQKMYKKNLKYAVALSSIAAPIVNTGIFAVGVGIFFQKWLIEAAGGNNALVHLFTVIIGTNFLVEFISNVVLAPTALYIIRIVTRNYNLGITLEDSYIDQKNK